MLRGRHRFYPWHLRLPLERHQLDMLRGDDLHFSAAAMGAEDQENARKAVGAGAQMRSVQHVELSWLEA